MQALPTTQEQVVHFLLKTLSLSSYDKRFLQNLTNMNFTEKRPVTTNQARLLRKVTMNYARQLAKQNIDTVSLVDLPWNLEPILSTPDYTQVWLSLDTDNNMIILHSPYKKEFIRKLREWGLGKWDVYNREWSFPAYEFSLKYISSLVREYYTTVNYCDELQSMMNIIADYGTDKIWDPTFVYKNGMYYIAATNEALDDAISDITLDVDVANLARLVSRGIKMHPNILIELDERFGKSDASMSIVQFMIDRRATWDQSELDGLVEHTALLNPTHVYLAKWLQVNHDTFAYLHAKLSDIGIAASIVPAKDDFEVPTEADSYYVVITDTHNKYSWPSTKSNAIDKIVTLVRNQILVNLK